MRKRETFTLGAAGNAIPDRRLWEFDAEEFRLFVERIRDADLTVVNSRRFSTSTRGTPGPTRRGLHAVAPVDRRRTDVGRIRCLCGGDEPRLRLLARRDRGDDVRTSRPRGPYAELNKNLTRTRAPAYVDTPAGRGELISVCSTITPVSIAGEQCPEVGGRS